MKKWTSWRRASGESWTNLRSNTRTCFRWWRSRSTRRSSNSKRKRKRSKSAKEWLMNREMSSNPQWTRWNCTRMRSDSTYFMRRSRRISRFCKHSTSSSNQTHTLSTTCSKTQSMLMTMAQSRRHYSNSHLWTEAQRTKPISICLEMTSTQKWACAMMWMKMSGPSRSSLIIQVTSSISVQPLSHLALLRFSSLEVGPHQRKILASTWHWRMKSWTNPRWLRVEMPMLLPSVKVPSLFLEVSLVSRDCVPWKSTIFARTSGHKPRQWRTRDTIWAHAQSVMNSFTLSVASSDPQSRRSTTALKCTRLKRISGKFWRQGWRIHFGPVVPSPSQTQRSCWSEVRTRTEMVKSICSMWTQRTGSHCTTWTNLEWVTNPSLFRIRSLSLVVTMICHAKFMTSKKINGVSFQVTTLSSRTPCTHSVQQLQSPIEQLITIIVEKIK